MNCETLAILNSHESNDPARPPAMPTANKNVNFLNLHAGYIDPASQDVKIPNIMQVIVPILLSFIERMMPPAAVALCFK